MSAMTGKPAAIQYVGRGGATPPCIEAFQRILLDPRDKVMKALILSNGGRHAFLLRLNELDLVAVKNGFGSGYSGEGSRGFSYVLKLLDSHGVEIDEVDVPEDLLKRVDEAALTDGDLKFLESAKPLRPMRWHTNVFDMHESLGGNWNLWAEFPNAVPISIIDPRLGDLVVDFWANPNDTLQTGYKRLEDLVRAKTGLREIGAKLFSQAFLGAGKLLQWEDLDEGEQVGRAQLFTGAYSAHRNPRAHRELKDRPPAQLSELLLLNHLYRLEAEAKPVQKPSGPVGNSSPPSTSNRR